MPGASCGRGPALISSDRPECESITRPEPDAERTAETLRAHGHYVLIAPMLRFEPVQGDLPDQTFEAVVMTSANAARALQARPCHLQLTSLPTFTVGRHTAEAARASGFVEVHSADGDRNDLAKLLGDRLAPATPGLSTSAGKTAPGILELPAYSSLDGCHCRRLPHGQDRPIS